jgi:DNA-binding response OmpR family regulator
MAVTHKILLVDDDVIFAETLQEQFRLHDELQVELAATAAEAREKIMSRRYDLVIMDVGLPDQDGRETCRALRNQDVSIPIIMLTGAASDADTILGLEAGANDYVTKPFKFGVLLARMRAHLRQYENMEQASLTLGPFIFQPALKLLETEAGEKVRLTEKETHILRYLYRAGGVAVPRQELLNEVWGYNDRVSTHTLETHIYRLRQKIEPLAADLLQTEAGGYRLNLANNASTPA